MLAECVSEHNKENVPGNNNCSILVSVTFSYSKLQLLLENECLFVFSESLRFRLEIRVTW